MLQVAIIGCGVIGPVHAAAVRLHAGAAIRWAIDRDQSKARERVQAQHYGSDAAAALADPAVDLVCICTPHPEHTAIAVAALAAGKHVLCEKPLASTPADLDRLLRAAAARPGQIASGIFQHRFAPLARRLRQLIAQDDFGALRSLSIRFACTRDEGYYRSAHWRGKWDLEGGGVAINQAIHTLDLGLWVAGARPEQLTARVRRRRLACIEVEDWLSADIACRGGVRAEFIADNDGVTGWQQRIDVVCERGAIALGDGHRLLRVDHASGPLRQELEALDKANLDGLPLGGAKDVYGYHHALQIGDVMDAIAGNRLPLVTFADAVTANAVVLASYHSAATGAASPVPPPAADYRIPNLPLEHA